MIGISPSTSNVWDRDEDNYANGWHFQSLVPEGLHGLLGDHAAARVEPEEEPVLLEELRAEPVPVLRS